jgi:cephalosporin hydroxylase
MKKHKAFSAFSQARTDKGYVHGYDNHYDKMFEDYDPDSLLEIGVKAGHSLTAWRIMFPDCKITGIDITNKKFVKNKINFSQAEIILEDSTKPEILNKLKSNFDVIIDDGSHYYKDIMRTFDLLHTRFNKYYVIEDYCYDLDMAKKFLNERGYYDISFYDSKSPKRAISKMGIYRTSSEDKIVVNQKLIVIRR